MVWSEWMAWFSALPLWSYLITPSMTKGRCINAIIHGKNEAQDSWVTGLFLQLRVSIQTQVCVSLEPEFWIELCVLCVCLTSMRVMSPAAQHQVPLRIWLIRSLDATAVSHRASTTSLVYLPPSYGHRLRKFLILSVGREAASFFMTCFSLLRTQQRSEADIPQTVTGEVRRKFCPYGDWERCIWL